MCSSDLVLRQPPIPTLPIGPTGHSSSSLSSSSSSSLSSSLEPPPPPSEEEEPEERGTRRPRLALSFGGWTTRTGLGVNGVVRECLRVGTGRVGLRMRVRGSLSAGEEDVPLGLRTRGIRVAAA